MVYHFLGAHASLVLRKQGDVYLPVGRGYLGNALHQIRLGFSSEDFFNGDQKPCWLTQGLLKQLEGISLAVSYSAIRTCLTICLASWSGQRRQWSLLLVDGMDLQCYDLFRSVEETTCEFNKFARVV